MSERNQLVRVRNYAITVFMPMGKHICNTVGEPDALEKTFIAFRDRVAKTHAQKVEYDRVRALFKYASTLGAVRCEVKHCIVDIVITLYFKDAERMVQFRDGIEQAIESAAMK